MAGATAPCPSRAATARAAVPVSPRLPRRASNARAGAAGLAHARSAASGQERLGAQQTRRHRRPPRRWPGLGCADLAVLRHPRTSLLLSARSGVQRPQREWGRGAVGASFPGHPGAGGALAAPVTLAQAGCERGDPRLSGLIHPGAAGSAGVAAPATRSGRRVQARLLWPRGTGVSAAAPKKSLPQRPRRGVSVPCLRRISPQCCRTYTIRSVSFHVRCRRCYSI